MDHELADFVADFTLLPKMEVKIEPADPQRGISLLMAPWEKSDRGQT